MIPFSSIRRVALAILAPPDLRTFTHLVVWWYLLCAAVVAPVAVVLAVVAVLR